MAFSTETKVGVLVIAAFAGLGWLSMNSGAFSSQIENNSRALTSTFDNAEGLFIGSQVKMAGVQVGTVTDIELIANGYAKVHFTVRNDVPLNANVQTQISTSGLIGEKFLALVTPAGGTGALAETVDMVPSLRAAAPEDIASNFSKVADDLEAITGSLRTALTGATNENKMQNIVNSFESFSSRLDAVLSKEIPEGSIANIVKNLEETSAGLNSMLNSNNGANKDLVKNISTTAENLAKITSRLEKSEGFLGKMMVENGTDEESLVASLQDIANEMRHITSKINNGEGTVGKLINEPDVANKLESTLEVFANAAERVDSFQTEVDFQTYALLGEQGINKSEFNLTLMPRPTRFYVLGVKSDGFANEANSQENPTFNPYTGQNFGHQAKFTGQFGYVMENAFMGNNVNLRMGIKDSTAGVGVDATIPLPNNMLTANGVRISTDVYDFAGEHTNDSDVPHVDVKGKVDLNVLDQRAYAIFGYDNVFNQEYGSPFLGLGFRFNDDDIKYFLGSAAGSAL